MVVILSNHIICFIVLSQSLTLLQAEEEAAEAEAAAKELGVQDGDSLRNLIMKKNQSREKAADDFFAQLEAKYAKPKGKKSQKGKGKT